MNYATREHMEQRFGTEELEDLAAGGNHVDRIGRVLADACAEIDAHIGVVYDLPLPDGTWPLLREIATDLARAELYDDATHEVAQRLAGHASELLTKLVAGDAQLVSDAGVLAARRNRAARSGPAPVMTPDNLAGL